MSGFTYDGPFRYLEKSINNECDSIITNTKHLDGQKYIDSADSIILSIDNGIDRFKDMYRIQPNTKDYGIIEWARDKLKEIHLTNLLDKLNSFADVVQKYQGACDYISGCILKVL